MTTALLVISLFLSVISMVTALLLIVAIGANTRLSEEIRSMHADAKEKRRHNGVPYTL